ncbi:MAG TPA: DNA-directed RNA polymerase subunit omega [Clostridiaceae bacterium]|nr:DNA-directed RNA polymerase subunit omega [Clostridiaceae bacterium]
MNNSMINPPIGDLLKKVNSRYTLVTMTAKRARQLIDGQEPLEILESSKPVTIAINEINDDLLTYETVKEGIK